MSYRLSIIEDIRNTRSRVEDEEIGINFQKIIRKQAEFIRSLQQQILLLKSYLTIGMACHHNERIHDEKQLYYNKDLASVTSRSVQTDKYQSLVRNIAQLLCIEYDKNINQTAILSTIKQLKEELNKKKQPIFVQRVKQIKVPITIQKIIEKPVQKIIEKIVYVQKPTVIFKEKIIERFIQRKQQPSHDKNNQKTLKISKQQKESEFLSPRESYRDYQNDYYYRSQDIGSNLIKKRENPNKRYAPKQGNNQKRYN